jgi:pimeloyl-ACP methyl ester carboxylesterase/V8-like Glu-specific endopeptidase
MTAKQRLLAEYARKVIGSSVRLESVGGLTDQHLESASGALESVLNDRAFRQGEDHVLEAIVLPQFRPALFIKEDNFDNPPDPWAHVAVFRDQLKPVIRAIGRIEVQKAGVPFGGTGFLCGPGLILTNRHVAEIFTFGVGGASKLRLIPGRTAGLDTAKERIPSAGTTFTVIKALMVHPHWDVALLQVKQDDDGAPKLEPLSLRAAEIGTDELVGREVVVIGYPYWCEGHDPHLMKEVFGGVYGVKRIQPGKLTGKESIISFAHMVEAMSHDSSTLGGNSGSAVVDLETQQVMALHFSGNYLKANYAVPIWELARDPRIVDAGVNFVPASTAPLPRTPEGGGPVWLSAWKGREEPFLPAGQPTELSSATPARPEGMAAPGARVLNPGWFESCPDEEIRRMYQRDPDQTRWLIGVTFSLAEAQEIYDTVLFDASTEGVREVMADPSLPEIILLPDILGSHLRGSHSGRRWLNLWTLPFSNLLSTLGLDRNGNDPNGLSADGHIGSYYSKAARTWRQNGFMVHEFSFDWRKPLSHAAHKLDAFMRERCKARPEARFALIGHGMGCLVSAIYALKVGDWRNFVDHAVLCGGPLGGTFAAMQMLSGEWPFMRKIAMISQASKLDEMRQMVASSPGVIELLPNPTLFSQDGANVELLYCKESYAAFARPGADWLQASRHLKVALRDTPLLGRATCLVCVDRPTATTFTLQNGEVRHSPGITRGDGTVAAVSALVHGVPAFNIGSQHADLLTDPGVIDAVPRLLRGQPLPLVRVSKEMLEAPLSEPAPLVTEAAIKIWQQQSEGIRERMRTDLSTTEDVRWLLGNA